MLNLGWFPFRRPFTFLNLVATPLVFAPRFRLPAAQLKLVRRTIRLLGAEPEHSVLDLACGRGASSFVLAGEHPSTHVTGVDVLPGNIEVARTFYANVANLDFVEGDAQRLDLPDASFDRVLCLEAAFHFPDRGRFLSEARRVVRSDGRVVVMDFMAKDDADPGLWDTDEVGVVRRTWQFERFDTVADYRANAHAQGFDVIALQDWSAHVTNPIQSIFDMVAWLGKRGWGRRLLVQHNRMLGSLSGEDWEAFDASARAHRLVRKSSRYMALVLSPAAS